jgi:hypothetical protein
MSTEAQINANRENAKLSTGPGPEGKKVSRLNAVKHNFTGHTVMIPPHLQEAYKQHYRAFREEHRPKGPTEQYLVDSLADLSWSVGNVRCQITSRIHLAGSRPLVNPHESHTPETEQAMAQAFHVGDIGPSMNTLGIYEQRKMRLFNTT